MELKYTPTTINEIEVENGNVHFATLVGDLRMKTLAMWIRKGMSLQSDKEAMDKITEYFEEGKSQQDLYVEILEALQKGGFVDKTKDIRQTLKDVQEGKISPEDLEKKA